MCQHTLCSPTQCFLAVFNWHLANGFQTAPGRPGDWRWNGPLRRAAVQRSCGTSAGCTTMSSPHHDGWSVLWAVGKEPASAQRLHKYCTGPSKWANTLAGLYHNDATHCRDHAGWLVDIRSPTQERSARLPPQHCQISSCWAGGVKPLLPSSSRCTDLELRRETHRLRSGLASAAPTLGLSGQMGGRSGVVCSHLTVYLLALSTAQLWVTADPWRIKTQWPRHWT